MHAAFVDCIALSNRLSPTNPQQGDVLGRAVFKALSVLSYDWCLHSIPHSRQDLQGEECSYRMCHSSAISVGTQDLFNTCRVLLGAAQRREG